MTVAFERIEAAAREIATVIYGSTGYEDSEQRQALALAILARHGLDSDLLVLVLGRIVDHFEDKVSSFYAASPAPRRSAEVA